MVEAVVALALDRLTTILEENFRDEIKLVRGVKKELLYLSFELTTIRNVLDDAERREYKEKSIKHWLTKLEDISYEVDDVLNEWNFAILKRRIEGSQDLDVLQSKVRSFVPCSCLSFKKVGTRRDIALKIKGLKEMMDMIMKEKDRYNFSVGQHVKPQESERVRSTSSLNVSDIHGRETEKDVLVRKLMLVDEEDFGPNVISIVGTGGIGKTTLAQVAYNDTQVVSSFELKIWICVSDVFDEVRIARGILEIVNGSSPSISEFEALLKCVTDSIVGQRFLLVLDDVWTEDYTKWEPFKNSLKCGAPQSKILVTTRSERVARMMGTTYIHHLGLLSDIDCWLLMKQIAFFGRGGANYEELQDIGKNIAKKCKGLPLAAKVLGSLLRFKDTAEEWENTLRSEIWQMEEAEVDLFPHLFLSYNELSPAMKRCFSYCAIFPKDFKIDIEKLIGMWMALGYLSSNGGTGDLELRGKEYFDNLRMRSFFQDIDDSDGRVVCKMHDIIHDFAQFLRKTTDHIQEDTNSSPTSQVKKYRSLVCQMELPPSPLDSVTCLRVLSCESILDWPITNGHRQQELLQLLEKSIHLKYLSFNDNMMDKLPQTVCKLYNLQRLYLSSCELKEIPREIGNLIHLRHLDLSENTEIQELPKTICNLQELRTLNLAYCLNLSKLPEGIHRFVNLRQLCNHGTPELYQIPQGLEQLTGLRTLSRFPGGSKLGCLNKLDQLTGSLELIILLFNAEDIVEARKAQLRNKKHIQRLHISFFDGMSGSDENELVRNEMMESLQPSSYLQCLTIARYHGAKFPDWISSSLNHLRVLKIEQCNYCSTLPPLGKLPCLEELSVWGMIELKFLKREFLGITTSWSQIETNGSLPPSLFPKLQKLSFLYCPNWEEWEDIRDSELLDDHLFIMPRLKKLTIDNCDLTVLPHHLLRKASALEHLTIERSPHLLKCYKDNDGSGWKSLSHIPHVDVLS